MWLLFSGFTDCDLNWKIKTKSKTFNPDNESITELPKFKGKYIKILVKN